MKEKTQEHAVEVLKAIKAEVKLPVVLHTHSTTGLGALTLQKAVEARDALQKELDDLKSAAAIREIRAKVSEETGIPMSLITAATEEDCKAQAQAILSFTQAQGYPAVKDAGEVVTGGKQTTKQQFAQWANEAFN